MTRRTRKRTKRRYMRRKLRKIATRKRKSRMKNKKSKKRKTMKWCTAKKAMKYKKRKKCVKAGCVWNDYTDKCQKISTEERSELENKQTSCGKRSLDKNGMVSQKKCNKLKDCEFIVKGSGGAGTCDPIKK